MINSCLNLPRHFRPSKIIIHDIFIKTVKSFSLEWHNELFTYPFKP